MTDVRVLDSIQPLNACPSYHECTRCKINSNATDVIRTNWASMHVSNLAGVFDHHIILCEDCLDQLTLFFNFGG